MYRYMYVTPHHYCNHVIIMYTMVEKFNTCTSIKWHIHLKYIVWKKHIIKWSKTSLHLTESTIYSISLNMGFLVHVLILIHNYFSIQLQHHPCQKRSWWKCNLMSDCIIKQHNWPLFVRPSDKLHQFNGILLVFNLNVSSLKGRWQRIILLLLYDLQAIHALYVLLRKMIVVNV